MDDPDSTTEPLLPQIERILAHDIPDPATRRTTATMIAAHLRATYVRVLRTAFDPYLDGEHPITTETVNRLLRGTILRIAGYPPADQHPTVGPNGYDQDQTPQLHQKGTGTPP